jgi:type IV pilus assembly protein PilB
MLDTLTRLLIDSGVATAEHVRAARERAAEEGRSFDQALVALGIVDEEAAFRAIAEAAGVPYLSLSDHKVDPAYGRLIPREFARANALLAIRADERSATVACADPSSLDVIAALESTLGRHVEPVVATRTEILFALDGVYGSEDAVDSLVGDGDMENAVRLTSEEVEGDEVSLEERRRQVERSPIIKLVNKILTDAIKGGASDIHVEPQEACLQIRYRVDGLLKTVLKLPKAQQDPLVSRLKIVSNMDIADKRRPQDGRAKLSWASPSGPVTTDLRVSTLPTLYGEKVVIRILDGSTARVSLTKLALPAQQESAIYTYLSKRQGIVLVTGPTGSGKTTTLYACLNHMRNETSNIVTLEDPIEYRMPDVNQVQVNERSGLTFAACLRSILRQDPNTIMVGEIRDLETAGIAFAAAQTGHFILSTLHTNDAAGAVTRLIDLGLEPFLVASSLVAVVAQRLLRRVCARCADPAPLTAQEVALLRTVGRDVPEVLPAGKGCEACHFTGYAGRFVVMEILEVTDSVRSLVFRRASDREIARAAVADGMRVMLHAGVEKALAGVTRLEEVIRVLGMPSADESAPETRADRTNAGATLAAPTAASQQVAGVNASGHVAHGTQAVNSGEPTIQSLLHAAAEDADADAGAVGVSAAPAIALETILVVDDSAVVRRVLREALRQEGWTIVEAVDGEDGWRKVVATSPDLVITDVEMPRLNGFGLIRRLKDHRATSNIPVLMLTSQSETESEVRGLEVGADDYVSKSAQTERVLARIRRLLRQRSRAA